MTTMSRFDECLAETLKWEGGWSDHPEDPGGATMKGITIAVFCGARGVKLTPKNTAQMKAELRKISDDEVRGIYYRNYWMPLRADELPAGLDLAVFDFGVNSGITRSAKYLQRIVGARQDGHIGDATIKAVDEVDVRAAVAQLMFDRRAFVRQIRTYRTFGKGWERRLDGVEGAAIAMLEQPLDAVVASDWQPEVIPAPAKAREPEMMAAAMGPAEKAGATGSGLSTAQIVTDAASAGQKVAAAGGDFSFMSFALELATRPSFVIACGVLVASAWMWISANKRRWLLE